jgi:hypothetical protein
MMRVLLACILFMACSTNAAKNPGGDDANAGGSGDATPRAAKVARIALSSASQLLNGVGATAQLKATAFDAAGDELPDAAVEWRSENETVVSVDAAGELTAQIVGTARVFAEVDGVSSPPLIAWVATLPEDTLLFDDNQLVSGPTLVGAADPMIIGTRFSVVLSDIAVPEVGTNVLAMQQAPVSGRVVSAVEGDEGVAVELEVVSLPELFVDLDFELHDSLTSPFIFLSMFEVAGFKCETEAGVEIAPEIELDASLDNSTPLSFDRDCEVKMGNRVPEHVLVKVTGAPQLDVTGSVTFPLNVEGSVVCKRQLVEKTFPVPVGGLAWLLSGKLPAGIGFELKGSFESTAVVVRAMGFLRADVAFGFEYAEGMGFRDLSRFAPTHGLEVMWDAPLLKVGGTLKASAFPFVYAEVIGGVSITDWADVEIGELRTGVLGELELSSPELQVSEPLLASKYGASTHGELSAGKHLKTFLNWIGLEGETINLEPPADSGFLKSPEGKTTASPDTITAGEKVTITADLDPATITFAGRYNVEAAHVWRNDQATGWHEVMQLPAEEGQTMFKYDWTPTAADQQGGPVQYAVTVETKYLPTIQLEVAPDSRQSLQAQKGGAPSPAMVGRYNQVSIAISSPGKPTSMQTGPSPSWWEIQADPPLVKWFDGTTVLTFGNPPLPVNFAGTSFNWANLEMRKENCPPDQDELHKNYVIVAGSVTLNADASAELAVRVTMEREYCGGEESVSYYDIVAEKPAPFPP